MFIINIMNESISASVLNYWFMICWVLLHKYCVLFQIQFKINILMHRGLAEIICFHKYRIFDLCNRLCRFHSFKSIFQHFSDNVCTALFDYFISQRQILRCAFTKKAWYVELFVGYIDMICRHGIKSFTDVM